MLYRSRQANAIFAKVGRFASEEVILELILKNVFLKKSLKALTLTQQLSNRAGISSISNCRLYSFRNVLRKFWQMLLMTIRFISNNIFCIAYIVRVIFVITVFFSFFYVFFFYHSGE